MFILNCSEFGRFRFAIRHIVDFELLRGILYTIKTSAVLPSWQTLHTVPNGSATTGPSPHFITSWLWIRSTQASVSDSLSSPISTLRLGQILVLAIPINCSPPGGVQKKDLRVDPEAGSWMPIRSISSHLITRDEDRVNGSIITFPAREHREGTGNAIFLF